MINNKGSNFQRKGHEPTAPRRVRHGVKFKSKEGPLEENWVAQRWIAMLSAHMEQSQGAEGLAYAQAGQVVSLEVADDGTVRARVQGRAAKPYVTQLRLPTFTEDQWNTVIAYMAGEATYAAKLLAHEMPLTLDQAFEKAGLELLPERTGTLEITCSCKSTGACKHAAAAGLLFADRLSSDPLLLFELHGMSSERVIERLRQVRAMQTQGSLASLGSFASLGTTLTDETAPGMLTSGESELLETCLDEFWRCGPQLADLEHAPPPQHVAHALLRRLGPSPMKGKFPLVGLLASIYDEVSAAAIRIRNRAEELE